MKKKKTIYWLGGVLVVLVIVALIKGGGEGDATLVAIETAELRTLVEAVSANGKVQPEVEVIVTADVSGEIVELAVKEGDEVNEGDLLAKIDPDIYHSVVDRARASMNTSKANLANSKARHAQTKAQLINAKATFGRNEKLHQQGAVSDADFDQAKAAFEVAVAEEEAGTQSVKASQFNVENAVAALSEAEENLLKTSIFAPIRGTVYGLEKEKGERVAGTSQFSAGTEIMRLANLHNMEVNVEVNENDIVKVEMGDTAEIEVDAYLDRTFKGVVTEIANSANMDALSVDQVTTFDVKIRIWSASYKDLIDEERPHLSPFRPGMTATVDIQTATVQNTLAVPIQAVTTRLDTAVEAEKGKRKYSKKAVLEEFDKEEIEECVFLYVDGKAVRQNVKTGIQDDKYIQVLSGIEAGQEVITAPYTVISKKLENGEAVEVVDRSELYLSYEK